MWREGEQGLGQATGQCEEPAVLLKSPCCHRCAGEGGGRRELSSERQGAAGRGGHSSRSLGDSQSQQAGSRTTAVSNTEHDHLHM